MTQIAPQSRVFVDNLIQALPRIPWIFVCVLVLGISLRGYSWLQDRDLWIDEAMLALNIENRTWAEFFQPLDYNQAAPVGLLLAIKACVLLFGSNELAYRFIPFLGSTIGLCLFPLLAIRILPRWSAYLATGLLAVSPWLVGYSGECKQYATDVAIIIGLLLMSIHRINNTVIVQSGWKIGLVGAIALVFSFPAVFLLAGLGTTLLWQTIQNPKMLRQFCWAVGLWLLGILGIYLLQWQHFAANRYLHDYWEAHFCPFPPSTLADCLWWPQHYFDFFENPHGLWNAEEIGKKILGVVALCGIITWLIRRDDRNLAVLIGATTAFVLAASALGKYPFAGRLVMFIVPMACLTLAHGFETLSQNWPSFQFALRGLIIVFLSWGVILQYQQQIADQPRQEQLVEVLTFIQSQWQSHDSIYIYNGQGDTGAGPAFAFYRSRFSFPSTRIDLGEVHRNDPAKYAHDIQQRHYHGRVWIVFSHRYMNEESIILEAVDGFAQREQVFHATGASVYSYRFPDPSPSIP